MNISTVKEKKGTQTKSSFSRLSTHQIERIVSFQEEDPFEVLGPHKLYGESAVSVTAFLPRAEKAWVSLNKGKKTKLAMKNIHPEGFYQTVVPGTDEIPAYKIGFTDPSGYSEEKEDPYRFEPEISEYDLYLFHEGNHYEIYEKLGAHPMKLNGVDGIHFAVWAPNAASVSIVGNFNHWYAGAHPMKRIHLSSVWGLFIPGLKEGEVYKLALKSKFTGHVHYKADPYATQAEIRPNTASVASALHKYNWKDQKWIQKRETTEPYSAPLSIYEVHLGSWKRDEKKDWGFLSYKDLAHQLVDYVKEMGYTHIQLMPVMEHPYDPSWGYQVIGYFAPTSRFGKPEEFMYFVDYCHQNGIGVLLDWVPGHFPKDEHGLAYFDGGQIYAYENWKKGEHKEWGTFVFDYNRHEVRNFLISNALFWIDKYHIDGLRVDAVASMLYLDYSRKDGEWEPNMFGGRENLEAVSFIKKFNEIVHGQYPGILTIAEESTAWGGVSRPTYTGGLGFGMKWNMGWMHDTLEYFCKDPIYRKYHQGMLTFSLIYAFTENFILPISHDELVYGKRSLLEKMPGDDWQKFANLRLFLSYMFAHPGKKLLMMGCDFGQRDEWNATASLDWHLLNYEPHQQIKLLMKDLNHLYRKNRALYEVDFSPEGFEWIDFSDADSSILSFVRWSRDREEMLVAACNMTPTPRLGYRIGVPRPGFYQEILNTDAKEYGGSGIGNYGGIQAEPVSYHNRDYSMPVNFPPLGTVLFKWKNNT